MDATSGRVSFGPFLLDLERGELQRAGELVPIAPKPLAVLAYLAANRDRAVPKQELRKQVWPDVFVSEAALASALKDLRRALGDDGSRQSVIRTLRRRGYRFVAKVSARAQVAEPSRGPRAQPQDPPAFVARGRELRALASLAARAFRGRPRVAILAGEAGTGKTRILEELLAHPACAGFALALGRCQTGASLPYLPFAEALAMRLSDAEDTAEQVLGDDAPILRPLLQLDAPGAALPEPLAPANAQRDRAELFAAVGALLARLARRRPTLLALEDLHAADPASVDLFADLVAAACEAAASEPLPLFVVATTRPPAPGDRLEEILRRVAQSPIASSVRIAGFGIGATRRFLDSLGVGRPSPTRLRRLQAETDGNPLFIREIVRGAASLEPARLRDADRTGGYGAGRTARARHGLRAAIAARVAQLAPPARAALTAAAFIGERFGSFALGAVCGADPEALRALLEEAARAELVVREQHSYRFDHPLVREVLCELAPERRRREIHRDIAAVFEDLYATSPGEHALEIAHHLVQAPDLVERARLFDYARRAGEQAFAVCAWHEAARFHGAAAAAASGLPAAERALQHLRAGRAANHDYDAERCLEHYAAAAEAFDEAGDDVGLAWSLMYLTRARFTFPSTALGAKVDVGALEELLERFGETHPALRALLLSTISEAHWIGGEIELAHAAAERAVAIGNLYDDDVASHHAFLGLALAQFSQLRVREALESWLEAAARARRSRDPWLQAVPGARISLALLHLGRLEEARERARAAADLARRAHNVGELGFAVANLAAIESVCGSFAQAESAAGEALAALERSGYPWPGVYALCARASIAAHRGAFDDASDSLAELVTPGRVFASPGPAVQFLAAACQDLIKARRAPRQIDRERVAGMIHTLQQGRLDPGILGGVSALAEVCEALREPALAKRLEEMLRLAHDRGIAFTTGWVFLVPRSIGRLAALDGRWDEAETWLDRALGVARGNGARVELAQTLLDRARVRAERRDGRRDAERARRDLDEAIPLLQELALRPSLRSALALRERTRGAH